MADSLYLSIWFPSFRDAEMMSRAVGVLRQFPFSTLREGITYLSVHPVAWTEPTVLERHQLGDVGAQVRFDGGCDSRAFVNERAIQPEVHLDVAIVGVDAFVELHTVDEETHRYRALYPSIAALIVAR